MSNVKSFLFSLPQQIFDQGCAKDTYPDDEFENRKNCERDWIDAKQAIDKEDVDKLDGLAKRLGKSHRIRVYASKPNTGNIPPFIECANLNWIRKYGWCEVADDTQGNWGICSPSCAFLGV